MSSELDIDGREKEAKGRDGYPPRGKMVMERLRMIYKGEFLPSLSD